MRTMVTGGEGFLGSYVVARLEDAGRDFFVVRHQDTDLTDQRAVAELFETTTPDEVIHLAAEVGGIGANQANPGRYWYSNLMMGVNVFEQGRIHFVQKITNVGSICAYPADTPIPFQEDDLWNGYPEETNAPYGIAKRALLVGGNAYRRQYGMNIIHLMPVNLYGPRDNFDLETSHVIPAMIRKMVTARDAGDTHVTLWGDGSATREFLYAGDAARGVLLAAADYDDPDPVNLGTGSEIAINDLAQLVADATGFTGEVRWDTTKPNGQARRRLDVTRARERFNFTAKTTLADGLQETVDWYLGGGGTPDGRTDAFPR